MHVCHRACPCHRYAEVMARWWVCSRKERRAVARKALVFLFEGDQLQVLIDEHHKYHWEPKTSCCRHLPDHHQKSPVTRDTDYFTLRITQLRGECRRNAKTH